MANNRVDYIINLKDFFTKGIKSATAETDKLNKSVGALKGMIAGIGIAALGKEILDVGSQFESAELGLKTLLGSAEEATKVFNQLKKDSESSPFGFETLLLGNKALISAGVSAQDARKDFESLANAIAATGGGNDELQRMVVNLQSIKNVGKANAMDIKQFAFAGVNIYSVLSSYSKKYGVTLDEQNITYEQLTAALKNAASEGGIYFNGLSNLANSTSGRLSNLGDSFKNTLYEVFKLLQPVIDAVVKGLTGMFNIIISIVNFIKENKTVFEVIASVVLGIATAMAVVKAQIILTTIAQWALNTSVSVFDALSGNWVALAAGATALAAGLWMAKNAQDGLNASMSGGISSAVNPMGQPATATPSTTASTKKTGTSLSAVETRQPQNFYIDIGNLIEQLSVNTTNLRESATAIKAEVTKAMIGAVNDFQLMAVK